MSIATEKTRFAWEIFTDDGLGNKVIAPTEILAVTNEELGLYRGVFRWVTGANRYDGTVIPSAAPGDVALGNGDPDYNNKWYAGIITQDSLGAMERLLDVTEGGAYSSLNNASLAVKNTNAFVEWCKAKGVVFTKRKARAYLVEDDVFYLVWSGEVESDPYDHLRNEFRFRDAALERHITLPVNAIKTEKDGEVSLANVPIAIGYCANAKLINITQTVPYDLQIVYKVNNGSGNRTLTRTGLADWIDGKTLKIAIGAASGSTYNLTIGELEEYVGKGFFLINTKSGDCLPIGAIVDGGNVGPFKTARITVYRPNGLSVSNEMGNNGMTTPENIAWFNIGKAYPQVKFSEKAIQGVYTQKIKGTPLRVCKPLDGGDVSYFPNYIQGSSVEYFGGIASLGKFDVWDALEITNASLEISTLATGTYTGTQIYSRNGASKFDVLNQQSAILTSVPLLMDRTDNTGYGIQSAEFFGLGEGYKMECIFEINIPPNHSYDEIYLCTCSRSGTSYGLYKHKISAHLVSDLDTSAAPWEPLLYENENAFNDPDQFNQKIDSRPPNWGGIGNHDSIPEEAQMAQFAIKDKIGLGITDNNKIKIKLKISSDVDNYFYATLAYLELLSVDVIGVINYELADVSANVLGEDLRANSARAGTAESASRYNVVDAIEHALRNYDGLTDSQLDTTSFATTFTERNGWLVGRQLTERKAGFEYLLELCQQGFLSIIVKRSGMLALAPVNVKGGTPTLIFNSSNIIPGSLSKMEPTPTNRVYNEFDFKAGFENGEATQTYRLTRTWENEFPSPQQIADAPDLDMSSWAAWCGVSYNGPLKQITVIAPKTLFNVGNPLYGIPPSQVFASYRAGVSGLTFGPLQSFHFGDTLDTYSWEFNMDLGATNISQTRTGKLQIWDSGLQLWTQYAPGFTSWLTARNLWYVCAAAWRETMTANIYPTNKSECKWLPSPKQLESFGITDADPLLKLITQVVMWNTRCKFRCSFSVPAISAFATLELGQWVGFQDPRDSSGSVKGAWVTGIEIEPKTKTIDVKLLFPPEWSTSGIDSTAATSLGIITNTLGPAPSTIDF